MATSSFSKNFVINDPKAVDELIQAMNMPTTVILKEKNEKTEKQKEREFLCKLEEQFSSLK